MYIALKWLIYFSLLMWFSLCYFDSQLNIISKKSSHPLHDDLLELPQRHIKKRENNRFSKTPTFNYCRKNDYISIGCGMLLITFLTFSVFNDLKNRKVCLIFMKTFQSFHVWHPINYAYSNLIIPKNIQIFNKLLLLFGLKVDNKNKKSIILNISERRELVEKNYEMQKEKKKLEERLVIALNENKEMKKEFDRQNAMKNSLINSENNRLDHQTQQVKCQHLYWLMSEKNLSLKENLRNMSLIKNEIEKNLKALVQEVFQSNNPQLKYFCSHMIMNIKADLFNINTYFEIDFHQNSCNIHALAEAGDNAIENIKALIKSLFGFKNINNRTSDVAQNKWFWDSSQSIEPKLRDKNKSDCLVKYSSSNIGTDSFSQMSKVPTSHSVCSANTYMVTGSKAFRKFLLETTLEL